MTLNKDINALSPDLLLNMIKSGAMRVISKESQINDINVFPVTDRDTGSNIAAMMRYFLAQDFSTANMIDLLNQISDAILCGACGNSGMIFSAFFTGLAQKGALIKDNTLTPPVFVECLKEGVKHAYQSVAIPVEGTILTVMSSWVNAVDDAIKNNNNNFVNIFNTTLISAYDALKKTEHQLLILEKNHIVDAGALGFVEFINGITDYLNNKIEINAESIKSNTVESVKHTHHFEQKPNYRYCAETLLYSPCQSIDAIKNELQSLGDSIVINHSAQYIKIHLHTSDVLALTELLKKYGSIKHQKIDSLEMQWEITHHKKNSIALVTDSSADIPVDFIQQEQIHILNSRIQLGEHVLLDRLTIDLNNLYGTLEQKNISATTAGPSPESITRYFNLLAEHYDSIIVIMPSAQLSSIYQSIHQLAAKINHKKITVIDSRKNSVAQGLLVMMAANWIKSGDAHMTIVNKIESAIQQTEIFVAVNEFKTMTKSGRAPKLLGTFATWTQFKPIVSLNTKGKPSFAGFAMNQLSCWKKIAALLNTFKKTHSINSAAIVHTSSLESANQFAALIEKSVNIKINFIAETSSIIGLHAGKGCVAIAISNEPIIL